MIVEMNTKERTWILIAVDNKSNIIIIIFAGMFAVSAGLLLTGAVPTVFQTNDVVIKAAQEHQELQKKTDVIVNNMSDLTQLTYDLLKQHSINATELGKEQQEQEMVEEQQELVEEQENGNR
jgi:hypothetical protein